MSLGCKRRREEGAAGSSGIDDYFWVNGDASQRGFKEFFRNEELSDCVLETSIGKSFKCHKVVLAAASPVFRAMFRSTMTEGTSSKVQMHDASAEAVQLLLRLVYGKSAMVPVKLSLELYMLADQYQLSRAADMIAEATGKALTPEALCFVLPEAHSTLINTSTLVRELLRRAAELIRVLPTCQQYQGWDLPLVQQVMRSDHSGRVYLILKAAAKWVQAAYDSRRQYWLGDLMPLISFDRLTTAELRHIKQHDPELLQLEGVGNALFKASCSKLQRDYYEISPNSPRYDDWRQMPPRRRSRSRSWSRSPGRRPSRSLSRSISRSRSRSLSGDLRRRRRSISRERSISQDYSGFESDTSGGQDDVPGGNLDDVQGNAMEVQADAMPDQGDAMEVPDNADGAQVNAIGTQDNAEDAQEHAVDAQDHVVDAQDNAMEV